ncbi:hypothetical protein DL771_008177 [Monosporascus sp. 5C6A]|nr:hypothetical protein DL771_008177 [Monosporascus sp. 5C6A]
MPWLTKDASQEVLCQEAEVLILSYASAYKARAYRDRWPQSPSCYHFPKDFEIQKDGECFDSDPYFVEEPEYLEDGDGVPKAYWHPWSLFNVMIVIPHQEKLGVHERFAVGILHEKALSHGLEPPVWKQICLG